MSIAENFRTFLADAHKQSGKGVLAFERDLGLKPSSIKAIISPSLNQTPSIDKAEKIAEALGMELYFGPPRTESREAEGLLTLPTWGRFTDRLLPRKGIASCGVTGWGKDQPLGEPLPAPEALDDANAFYVSASGESMMREGINGGMFCLVSPAKSTQPGDRIWIRDANGTTAIKRLMKIDDDRLYLRGWQPRQDGQQKSFDEERFLNFIAEYYPVVAVYQGKPGDEAARLISDPRPPQHIPKMTDDMIQVRLHDQQFAAGHGTLEEDGVMSSVAFPAPWLRRLGLSEQSAALVWVKGDSMEPTLKSGAMAMLDTRIDDVKKRKIYAFRYGEELFIKRLERIAPDTLIAFSDNAAYDTIAIVGTDLEQFQMFGEVVWSGHKVGK
jgi:phage repressor protein C with HTH and peptisase S24 domain